MRNLILGTALLAGILALSTGSFAQATLETTLTHGLSTTMGTKLGTALGNATNQLAGKVAQQTSTATPRQTISVPKTGVRRANGGTATTTANAAQPANGGSMILSIEGGAPQNACIAKSEDSAAQSDRCSTAAAKTADAHPSVVNLPAAQ